MNVVSSQWSVVSKAVLSFTLGAALFTLALPVEAQQTKKLPRMGLLWPEKPEDVTRHAMTEAFLRGLRDLGYEQGKNIAIEHRYAEGRIDLFAELAAELVGSKLDLIVTGGTEATRAAKNATKTIPIVMVGVGVDPVETGLIETLARPGGNITGFTNLSTGISGKRLELLKEAAARIARVAVLSNPADESNLLVAKEAQTAARSLGLTIRTWDVQGPDSFQNVFAALSKDRPDGLLLPGGPLINGNESRIAGFALKSRLPSMFTRKSAVDAGGLISYGVNFLDHYRRAATYVDKILKGAKPADLPVEQPTKFEFVINLKTAKQIGLTIPQKVLIRADRVIR
jgi:ABC-type uncharacterized transport system substrate-binding protein